MNAQYMIKWHESDTVRLWHQQQYNQYFLQPNIVFLCDIVIKRTYKVIISFLHVNIFDKTAYADGKLMMIIGFDKKFL